MSEPIYLIQEDGTLVAMTEQPYTSEAQYFPILEPAGTTGRRVVK